MVVAVCSLDSWLLLFLVACLLHMIYMTGYSCRCSEFKMIEWAILSLFVVLLIVCTICTTGHSGCCCSICNCLNTLLALCSFVMCYNWTCWLYFHLCLYFVGVTTKFPGFLSVSAKGSACSCQCYPNTGVLRDY